MNNRLDLELYCLQLEVGGLEGLFLGAQGVRLGAVSTEVSPGFLGHLDIIQLHPSGSDPLQLYTSLRCETTTLGIILDYALSLNNRLDYAGIDRLNNRLDYAGIDLGLNYFDLEVDQHSGGDVVIELK
ncbi:hypothetical protein PGT21_001036 [Puccinia graminis f. sp. tritici]|uniref:Uncharacterized protein n=1 Tax=Puccinia graminis f. sp. tritici TaxID=56615 RepID=A0A5B0SL90_PUCGR|nr:hypothetical protein PGT21_001036 [Puccinia graminis f. sp. tritici]KAA1137903.1 hypothetical protein PGTUg99_028910 [Puccinia graminis f. sp. tritici]